ncbi:hypothetical protein CIK96_06395 [Prevotella sp. P4-98]|uniref:hypothetical protein n=1 Tax=Prevotella sp. P4-98 TaxID=2024219 RepID=UPI000B975BA0|nr:hypothetical protein [Prevotella sp. P4-98]OYP46234.1 hypothetical protein CIK96_06395 [Prevotella sp. P4-98]
MMRKFLLSVLLCSFTAMVYAQSFDQERIALSKFIERMFNNAPFEGCRIVDDYDNSYLLSVVELDKSKYKTSSVMNRVAQVKSQRNAGEFFNGTQSYSEITIRTPKSEEKGGKEMAETYEIIRTNSTGFVQQLALLTQFESNNGTAVFVFYKKVNK